MPEQALKAIDFRPTLHPQNIQELLDKLRTWTLLNRTNIVITDTAVDLVPYSEWDYRPGGGVIENPNVCGGPDPDEAVVSLPSGLKVSPNLVGRPQRVSLCED